MNNNTPLRTLSALIVDNDKLAVKLLSRILTEKELNITCAYSGLEALQVLAEKTFDLVFLDLIMPRIGGDRICRYITQSPRHAHSKVFIVSGAALEGRGKIAELKPFACIAKAPYDILRKNLLSALEMLNSDSRDSMHVFTDGVHSRSVVEELLFSQRHFETILSSMAEAVFELDTDCTITYVNESARQLFGRQEWEMIGRKFSDEFNKDDATAIRRTLDRMLRRAETCPRKLVVTMHRRDFSLSFRNVLRDGELIGATVVANDITEKKLLDQERGLSERLAGVIEMAGAAAHELNQPLTVISGHAQLLLRQCRDSAALERRARIIYDQVERLGRVTKQFSGIVAYKTKKYGKNLEIIDIERSSEDGEK
jgi:two-component system, cell cycle sensor histidine kinase and response regulator CckA